MDLTGILHHPLFQSLALPLLLSWGGIGLLRAGFGPARAAAAIGLSVLASTVWLLGWPPQPASVMQKLPWVIAAAWLAGVALDAAGRSHLSQWILLTAVWLAASWWLGGKGAAYGIVLAVVGAIVIACMLQAPDDRADAATTAVVASLGLAAVAFAAGSLALFQLSLLLAAAVGAGALWLWPKARIRFGPAAVAVAAITWLALAQATLLLTPARPQALALLAAAFVAAPLLGRLWSRGRVVAAPLAVAVLSGVCVAAALVLQAGGATADGSRGTDDAYYEK